MSATHNRVAPLFYDSPPKTPPARTLPPLPKTPAERQQALADATFSAVLALQGLLTSADPKVVIQAAGMILDLDKTQMRHRTQVCGTFTPFLDPVSAAGGYGPSDDVPGPQPTPQPVEPKRDLSNPFVQYVLRVQKRLQAKLDEAGLDDDISWEEAEEVAVEEIQKERIRRDKLRAEQASRPPEPTSGGAAASDRTTGGQGRTADPPGSARG